MPQADFSVYDGNTVVKTSLYSKANLDETKAIESERAKRLVDSLEITINKYLTFDSLDYSRSDIEDQMRVNKKVADELRKEMLKLKTFIANNYKSVDN